MNIENGSYLSDDVTFLLKDLSHLSIEKNNEIREKLRSEGVHYSRMLPIEYTPKNNYMMLYYELLEKYGSKLALDIGILANRILKNKGENIVLVSLARAGTPIGVLLRRYFKEILGVELPHYSISIIRDIGIDGNAISYIKEKHPKRKIQFIDGWTGKGAITKELKEASSIYKKKYNIEIEDDLAVISDPGYCAECYSTREDIIIPSSLLNSTISGLVSRTVYNEEWIEKKDFHGAKLYKELSKEDKSLEFIEKISREFSYIKDIAREYGEKSYNSSITWEGMDFVKKLKKEYNIDSVNKIKPGIAETTRVLLRRVPWKIIVKDKTDFDVSHILLLAKDKSVEVIEYKNMPYRACGIVKKL